MPTWVAPFIADLAQSLVRTAATVAAWVAAVAVAQRLDLAYLRRVGAAS